MKKDLLKYIIYSFIFICTSTIVAQPTPGGIGTTNLSGWFRADDLVLGDVTNWTTTYPTGPSSVTVTDAQAPYPQLTMTPTGAVSNYNRTIEFTGNTYAGQNLATVQGLYNPNPPEFLKNAYSGNQGSFFCAYYLPMPSANNGHMMLYNHGNDAIQIRNLTTKGRIGIGLQTSNSLNASRDWDENFRPNVSSYRGNRSNSTSMNAFNRANPISSNVASQSSGSEGLSFGYAPSMQTSAYNGYLHEFIFFNRDLTDLEMNKVHTYLAIKYGITLNNQLGGTYGDYVATNGTIIWDADNNASYHNDVIGIGRDDIEGLNQKQSHAFDDSVRVYISTLSSANETNTGTINADISYITMGHNTGALCGTAQSNAEAPTGITSRLEREFKITKTNFDQEFSIDIRIDTCRSIENITVLSNIRLLVDNDGDFTNATALSQLDGLTFSVLDGTVTIAGITSSHLANNSTNYITIGYMNIDYTIQGSPAICQGEEGWIIVDLINTTGPISISYTDGTNNFNLNSVMDGDTVFISPSSNTTYTFEGLAGLFNCCSNTGGYQHTQIVNTKPNVQIITGASNICVGDQITLNANGANSYQWDNGVQNNIPFSPAQTTTYTVVGTNTFGCTDTASITIDVFEYPNLDLLNPVYEICEGTPLTYNATGAQTYVWNNGIQNGFEYTPAAGSYTNQVVGFNGSCTDTLTVNLVVYEQPIADAVADVTNGIADLTVNFTNYSSNATSISWNFDNGEVSNSDNTVSTTYSEGGTYYVTLTATNQICTDTWTEIIFVEPGEIILVVPNVFSPNGDGYNDTYFLETQNIEEISGSILNRWGNVMYEFNDVNFIWDGDNTTDGVYTIVYTAKGKNGNEISGQGFINVYK